MSTILTIRNLNVWFGNMQVLKDLSFDIETKQVTAFIGPSNSGKTTLIRCLNRLNDLSTNFRHTGDIHYNGDDLYGFDFKPTEITRKIGMVFNKPIPFRKSIFENVTYSAKLRGVKQPRQLASIVEDSLRKAQLWDEVKELLHNSPDILSKSQQQRLCIARALSGNPEIMLFDEPCGQLDATEMPIFESIIQSLKNQLTIVFVTNKRRQAARVSDVAGFLYDGELVEIGRTEQIFTTPVDYRTENYVTGRLG